MSEPMTTEDDYLDDLGFERPDPDPDDDGEPIAAESDTEPEPEPVEEPEKPEAKPVEAKEPVEEEKSEVKEGGDDDLRAQLEEANKRNEAVIAELSRIRKENRERARREVQTQAPAPTQAPPSAANPAEDGAGVKIPVNVAGDGSEVYVDLSSDQVREMIRREAIEANKPSPEAQARSARMNAVQGFINELPERNVRVAEDMALVDQYLGESLVGAMRDYGYTPQNLDDTMRFLDQTGIQGKITELFPTVAPHMRSYLAAIDSDSPEFLGMVLRNIANGYEDPREQRVEPDRDAPKLKDVSRAPRSLSKVGGDRTVRNDADDEREFSTLEKKYAADPIMGITAEEHSRWRELGAKLGKKGF